MAHTPRRATRDIHRHCRAKRSRFGVLCPATTTAEAVALLDRERGRLAALAPAELPRGLRYTFSVGVDERRRDESLAQLMARADGALYAAKASGRDRVMAAA
ncbi:diguanylate cyclase [Paraburkholderia sediminicola]|uniref:Diguanylate cyclase n=1 Tax=Paraburkholderia rhynchosiae TaxID=487049 RepID=A0ACC7NCS0_9BURK